MFIETKYTKWYMNIIGNAKKRASSRSAANEILGYSERHHIVPKCMGGTNDKENLVYLSAREHFICHVLLIKMVSGEFISKMRFAIGKFIQENKFQKREFTSRQYEVIRKNISEARKGFKHTEETRKKISEGHIGQIPWNKGLKLDPITDDHKNILSELYLGKSFEERFGIDAEKIKRDISESKKGKPSGMLGKSHSDETKEKMRKSKPEDFGEKIRRARMGIEFSEEHLENIRKANAQNGALRKGIKRKLLECPHCGKIGGNSQMKRYHFSNCRRLH